MPTDAVDAVAVDATDTAGTVTALARSRYLLLSPLRYRAADGAVARFGFATRTAKLFHADPETMDRLGDGAIDELPESEVERLRELGALVAPGEDELSGVTAVMRAGSDRLSARMVTIMPTSYCNMACDYCGQEHFKAAHDQRRMDAVARRVEAMLADPAVGQVVVTWFGGEPLLALRVVRELSARFVAAAERHGKRYSARMASNGSLLTARTLEQLATECRLRSIEVTIDGPEPVHDERRVTRNGRGTFHRIIGAIAETVRSGRAPGLDISVRINVDHRNEDQVPALMADLACLGLGATQVRVQLSPVHSWGLDVSAVEVAVREYARREARWLELAEALRLDFVALPEAPIASTCKATTRAGEIIDPSGRIFSCSEHPLVPGAPDGAVVATVDGLTGSQRRPAGLFDDWFDEIDTGEPQCARCPILPVCGGACPKLWREGHVPCPSVKHNWVERMDIAARRLGFVPVEPVR